MIPLFLTLMTQTSSLIPTEIENEQIQGINKIPYHSTLQPYGSLQEALLGRRDKSSFARSLNGTWKFNWVKRPELRPIDFYRTDFDVSSWKSIAVPSNWQVLGYGTPYYRNNGYTFQRDWPRVMTAPPKDWTAFDERNPVGSYRREFEVPSNWDGRETFLKFDGVDAGFFLWINGQKVGYSQNSRNAAEFDISKYLHAGKNLVAVEVYRYTSGSYFEDQDMWRLSGIFRNVTLWSAPKLHIQDTRIVTDLDSAYKNATLRLAATIHNYSSKSSSPTSISTELFGPSKSAVKGVKLTGKVPSIAPGEEATVTLESQVSNPQKWSAETPNLYTAVIKLGASEILSHRVGFRKVEIKNRVFMVNGQPVKLKGANRHEMNMETGHYVTEADMIQDLIMLKKGNCNHVRTCHYSDDPRWYELCDEWGIYLVAEANAECHGYYNTLDREPRFERMVVDRNVANVENLKNHPSILIWSLGNECGSGSNFRAALKAIEQLDTTRPTHYEPFGEGTNNPASIDSHMYTDPDGLERIANNPNLTKPMYLCEYAHAMNNSMGSIGDYNDLFDKYPALMGGAIWEWEDQGLWNRRDPKHPIIAYGGGFGENPNDGYFIHKGVVFSDRTPKPHFPEMKRAYQWISFTDLGGGKVGIKNRFNFTNLSKFGFKWTIISDEGTVATGTVPTFSLAPGKETTVQLDLPKLKVRPSTSLYLNVAAVQKEDEKWAPKGFEVANGQFAMANTLLETVSAPPSQLEAQTRSNGDIEIAGPGFSVTFDHASGTISSLKRAGAEMVTPGGGPKLHLWRAQHRNDDGWAAGNWRAADLMGLQSEILSLNLAKDATGAAVVSSSIRYVGKNNFSALHLARFTVYGDGTIAVDNAVSPTGPKMPLARVGVRFLLNPALSSLNYFARGPMENYSDRKRGSDVGRYVSTVDQQLTAYEKPQEGGNHEDMKWLTLSTKDGLALTATADKEPLQFSAVPYRDEDMENVQYRIDLPKPNSTVLILSGKTLGVGSAACGPRPLPQYRLDSSPRAFSYVLHLGKSDSLTVPQRPEGPALVSQSFDGHITLSGGEAIETSTNGQSWTPYSIPISVTEPIRLNLRSAGFTGTIAVEPPVSKSGWRAAVSDFESGEGNPEHVIDNNPDTFWHSRYSPSPVDPPHWLIVDLGKESKVGQVLLTPRQDNDHGRIRGYAIEVSNDRSNWTVESEGTLPNRESTQVVRLKSKVNCRYVRLTVRSDWSNGGWATLAEFEAKE